MRMLPPLANTGGDIMRGSAIRVAIAVAVGVLGLSAVAVASGKKASKSKFHHVLVTFTGSGKGNYAWSVPEDDTGNAAGVCNAPSNSYTTVDNYAFSWSEKFSFPDGVGTYVLPKNYTASGTDVSTQQQGTCTNGFGNILGGDSFACTTQFNPLPSSDTDYPMITTAGRSPHLTATTGGSISASGAPTGTHCAGASLGASYKSYSFEGLKDSITVSAAQLEKKGSLSKPVSAQNSESCGSTTCDRTNCANDLATAGAVPTTCSNQQSYMGELKVTLVK